MRFALIALLSAVVALAQPTTRATLPLNPPNVSPDFHGWNNSPVVKRAPVTNAERFAQGLPPLKSKARRHRGGPHLGYLPPGTRVRSAPRAETSPTPPVTTTCNIFVTDTDGNELGYVSPTWNIFGEYGDMQSDRKGALEVKFVRPDGINSQMDMVANNGPDSRYPYVGGVSGFSANDEASLGPGQIDYAYLAGTPKSDPGSPPVDGESSYKEASGLDGATESAIWSYNPATDDITAQWVNPDGTMPTTYITMISGVMVLTGDPEAAQALGDVQVVKFNCYPPVTV